jgi:hypothetical protein
MRFEKLLWAAFAMFLAAAGVGDTVVGAVSEGGEYQAADGGTGNPPPERP